MNHQAKAPSAGSTQATGNSRGLVRRALANRAAFGGSKGSSAPAARRLHASLAALALAITAFAVTAAPASAAPLAVTTPEVSNVSYGSVHVAGKLTTPGGGFTGTTYAFQYSTNPSDPDSWRLGLEANIGTDAVENKTVEGNITGLKGATEYFVRLYANTNNFFNPEEATSPGPHPSFTTLAVDPPMISGAVDASPIFSTSAMATGEVKRPANPDPAFNVTACRFEYVADEQFTTNGFADAGKAPCIEISDQNPITAPDEAKAVTAPLGCTNPVLEGPEEKCLKPATTYHLRLVAENAGPSVNKDAATTFTTEPAVAKPAVLATDNVADPGQNTAKVSGEIQRPAGDDPALNASCRFEYVTEAQFTATGFVGTGQAVCAEAPPEAPLSTTDPTEVSADLAGLKPATTYHLRLAAENGGGTETKEAAATFTTKAAELPTVTIDPVAGGTFTTAHVSGTVNTDDPGHPNTPTRIEISTDNVNWSGFEVKTPQGDGLHVVEWDFTGLQPSTTYYFRIISKYASNSWQQGEANGEVAYSPEPNPSITTEPLTPPSATIDPVTAITGTSAHFSGTVDPHAPAGPLSEVAKKAFATHWEFVCTPECKNANGNPIEGTVQGEEGAQTVTGDAKRLEPGKHYEVSLVISSEGGGETVVEVFDTLEIPPAVKQTLGAPDGKGGYTLQGVVNPNNQTITDCEFEWGPNSAHLDFSAPCSPAPVPGAKPTTVEAHLTGLNPGVDYHALLVVTYGAGSEAKGVEQTFKATLAGAEPCPANEQERVENSSLALPECRAYEMVTPPGKEGFDGALADFHGSDIVRYYSEAGNIAHSGQGSFSFNSYATKRTAAGWETIPNLNGSSGSIFDAPSEVDSPIPSPSVYSEDLLASIWGIHRKGDPVQENDFLQNLYLRAPGGTFILIAGGEGRGGLGGHIFGASDGLSHLFVTSNATAPSPWGPGVYEFVGTANEQPPARADVDNSGSPITTCKYPTILPLGGYSAGAMFNSRDGRVFIFKVAGGCGGANPPAQEIWARVNGTTSIDISASQCNRIAPADPCNAPANSTFQGATSDGSRAFFTTTQQLVDEDTDQTNDIYACDIPSGNSAPAPDKANPCAPLRQVSGAQAGAAVESVDATSGNGATVLFTAKGVLAANEDAFGDKALAGDHNLYVWRTDAAHPDGQTAFVGRLDSNDLSSGGFGQVAQATPDGQYLVFTTASQLLDTDTDTARDVYRYDAGTGGLTRVSTNVIGVAGNGDGLPASIGSPTEHHPTTAISDDGTKIVFISAEALNVAADGNAEPDVYLWTPARVSLISTGAVGGGVSMGQGKTPAAITSSGQDIYFRTRSVLTPADGDDSFDVYDARIGGGFSFAPPAICSGEKCQPDPTPPLLVTPSPANRPNGEGNIVPKTCPKGKVLKKGKCVKKPHKKHSGKKDHGKKHKRAGSDDRGDK